MLSARSQVCGEGQEGPRSAWWTQKQWYRPSVGPWQYQIPYTGWVLPLPSQYPVYHPSHQPRYAPTLAPSPVLPTVAGTLGTCTYDRFGDLVGDPRGVIRTVYGTVGGQGTPARCTGFRTPLPWSPCLGSWVQAPGFRLLGSDSWVQTPGSDSWVQTPGSDSWFRLL